MRVTLLYNPQAGEGVSLPALREEIERRGHEILHVVEKDADIALAFDGAPDLIVAAGGDGTVSRAALALAGRDVPLAIVPIGTANNIARSLGIDGAAPELVASWDDCIRTSIDIGLLRSTWGERRFIEGAGVGLVATAIAALQHTPDEESGDTREAKLEWALQGYLDALTRLKPRQLVLTLDGTRIEEPFLLVEVLNIASLGPNLVWSADADPSDGLFSIVTAGEGEREALDTYLRGRMAGSEHPLHLPTRHARRVEIEHAPEMHIDDEVRSWSLPAAVSMEIVAGVLKVLGVGIGRTIHGSASK